MITDRLLCNNKVLAHNIIYCDGLFKKATGLMFRSKDSVNDTAWWFRFKNPRRVSVTMFFVFFPIDLIFLDDKDRIVEIRKDIRPFQNYTAKKRVSSFIELKSGSIKRTSLRLGMRISKK